MPSGTPSDLLSWSVTYGFDNPILSTDTVTDPETGETHPATPPLIDVTDADVLTPAQVSPWMPPEGYNTNLFSGPVLVSRLAGWRPRPGMTSFFGIPDSCGKRSAEVRYAYCWRVTTQESPKKRPKAAMPGDAGRSTLLPRPLPPLFCRDG